MTDENVTKVVFRRFKTDGSIIAIFPEVPATCKAYECQSYQHVGQHGACDPIGLISETLPVPNADAARLKAELESLGYRLKVCRQITHDMYLVRRGAVRRQNYADMVGGPAHPDMTGVFTNAAA